MSTKSTASDGWTEETFDVPVTEIGEFRYRWNALKGTVEYQYRVAKILDAGTTLKDAASMARYRVGATLVEPRVHVVLASGAVVGGSSPLDAFVLVGWKACEVEVYWKAQRVEAGLW